VTVSAGVGDAARIRAIRAQFPALARRHHGHPVAYLDGPGGTQVPQCVVDAMSDYLLRHNANTHWEYPTSRETDALIDGARQAFADFFNATAAEVVFGANMTALTFHLARALGRAWGPGDEVVVTELDHHGNIGPWQAIERERGITLRWVPFRPADGTLDLDALAAALGPRTRLVAFGWASNALGTVNDVDRICRLAREAGALAFVDAVHSAPHLLPDVAALGCDFLACSAYKFYGPHLGVLYVRRATLETLDVPKVAPAPDTAPERLELGTQIHEGIVGAGRAVDFIASLAGPPDRGRRAGLGASYRWLQQRAERQVRQLWDGLGSVRGLRRYGPPPGAPRTPTVSFTWSRPSAQVASELAERGVFASHGDFYAATVVQRLALEGLVRVGCACFTDPEVDQLLAALADLQR
jgi:cysteine desulfurase family protein (TIGR01976 family)